MHDRSVTETCLNCDQPLADPRPRYCPACGQATNERVPTVREFWRQFTGSYLTADGAMWRTLRLMAFSPGRLSTEYLRGRRRRYVLPVRLYLSVAIAVLLVLRLAAPVEVDASAIARDPAATEFTVLDIGTARLGLKDGRFFCENLPAWVCTRVRKRVDQDPRGLAREVERAGERFIGQAGTAMAALVPIFAALTMLAYAGRRLRYAEHLVFAVHVHTAWLVLLALVVLLPRPLSVLAGLAMPLYHLRAARVVYGGGRWSTLLRAAVVAAAYAMTLAVALALAALAAFFG